MHSEREVYSKQAGAAAAPSKWDGERAVAVALEVLVVVAGSCGDISGGSRWLW